MIVSVARILTAASWFRVTVALGCLALLLAAENIGARPLDRLLLYAPGVDKGLHFMQSLLIFFGIRWLVTDRTSNARTFFAVLIALAAAGYDELQQWFTGGRHIELADIGAGFSGIVFGAGASTRLRPRTALVLMVSGLALGGVLTARSYYLTRDYNEGLRAERDRRFADARRAYLRAIERGIRNPEIYNAAAWALVEFGAPDPDRAVKFAEASLALRPGDPDTLDTYGWALQLAGRHVDAVRALEEAQRLKPEIYCVNYHLAMAYLAVGRRQDGVRHLILQRQTNPGADEARRAAEELARLGEGRSGAK